MLISVIIPTYKPKAGYLGECLDSLFKQTLNHADFEVIIILNGCNEPYREMVDEVLGRFDGSIRVRIIQTDVAGQSNARNIGLESSDSPYVCFVDYDDILSDSYLERLLSVVSDGSVIQSNVIAFDDESGKQLPDYIGSYFNKLHGDSPLSRMKGIHFMSNVASKLIPRSVISDNRFIQVELGEDCLFMATVSNRIKRVVLSHDDAIYYRRVHRNSLVNTNRTLFELFKNRCRLTGLYLKTYFSGLFKYNPLLFFHRIVAVWKGFFKSIFF